MEEKGKYYTMYSTQAQLEKYSKEAGSGMKRKQSGLRIMSRLHSPSSSRFPALCVLRFLLGVLGFLCAIQITVAGSLTLLTAAKNKRRNRNKDRLYLCIIPFGRSQGISCTTARICNHYIAFKLLALIRDKVFKAMRRLSPRSSRVKATLSRS